MSIRLRLLWQNNRLGIVGSASLSYSRALHLPSPPCTLVFFGQLSESRPRGAHKAALVHFLLPHHALHSPTTSSPHDLSPSPFNLDRPSRPSSATYTTSSLPPCRILNRLSSRSPTRSTIPPKTQPTAASTIVAISAHPPRLTLPPPPAITTITTTTWRTCRPTPTPHL
jgi:hypothetical protein